MNNLKASLGFKGERGYSAYEIAVQNGFEGAEQDWLATLGTSSHLTQDKITYTSAEGQTEFNLPSNYTSDTFVDVYLDGSRLTSYDFTVSNNKVILTEGLEANQKLEIVEMTMSTNNLPIVTTIDSESTDDTVASSKCLYTNLASISNSVSTNANNITNNINKLNSTNDVIGIYQDTYSSSSEYSIGDVVVYNSKIYVCKTTITQSEEFDIEKWNLINVVSDGKINNYLLPSKETENVLWEIEDLDISQFNSQEITLANENYDYLEIYYFSYTGKHSVKSVKVPKGHNFEVDTIFAYDGKIFWGSRLGKFVDESTILFNNCYGINNIGLTREIANDWVIPIKIVGLRG